MSKVALVTGASSGLGKLVAQELQKHGYSVVGVAKWFDSMVTPFGQWAIDLSNQMATEEFLRKWPSNRPLDVLVNCAGINKIGYIEDFSDDSFLEVMNVNVVAAYRLVKGLLPHLIEAKGTVLNIVSNASHVPMTASTAYNASKGAMHIMTLQLARELTRRHGITVFGISPNKMRGTGMSNDIGRQVCEVRGWTPEQAEAYQKAALVTGEETDPALVAEFIGFLLSTKERHASLSGCVLPYGA